MDKKERLETYFRWILEAIEKIEKYSKWSKNKKLKWVSLDWCWMQLIWIWEVANRIQKYYPKFDKIPNKKIVWLRNIVAYDYISLDPEIVEDTINYNIPELKLVILQELKNIEVN